MWTYFLAVISSHTKPSAHRTCLLSCVTTNRPRSSMGQMFSECCGSAWRDRVERRQHQRQRDRQRSRQDALYAAVEQSNVECVRRLLSEWGGSASQTLMCAVKSEDIRIAPDLLSLPSLLSQSFMKSLKTEPWSKQSSRWAPHARFTPLHYAARNGQAEIAEAILSKVSPTPSAPRLRAEYCDRLSTIEDGQTALHIAVFAPSYESNQTERTSCTSSRYVARELGRIFAHGQRHPVVELLLSNGASVDLQVWMWMLYTVEYQFLAAEIQCLLGFQL